jgi:hypothetical protein
MPNIRQLIEHLDVTGDYRQFALDAQPFGDDLVQAWRGIENGAHLLWLAAAVGVEPKRYWWRSRFSRLAPSDFRLRMSSVFDFASSITHLDMSHYVADRATILTQDTTVIQ